MLETEFLFFQGMKKRIDQRNVDLLNDSWILRRQL